MPGELETEKPMEGQPSGEEGGVVEKKQDTAPASRPVVGIIYPPPEVRNIVDKTADFVARNGPEFAERIKLNEAGNPKFNFLSSADPYNAYFKHKIEEIRDGVEQEALMASQRQQAFKPPPKSAGVAMVIEPAVPTEPPPEYEFMAEPPSISAAELDIVKLTAQFVARNGAQFLDKLMMREQRNYQFDFLRKQHPLFSYFTRLVEQYNKVLLPLDEVFHYLKKDIEYPLGVLEHVTKRVEWETFQNKQRKMEEEVMEKERVEYAQIDWHDFVLVETVNFRENESGYLPPPIRPTQLAQRLLQQQKYERITDEGGEVQEVEMDVEESDVGEEPLLRSEERPPKPPEPENPRPPSPPKSGPPPLPPGQPPPPAFGGPVQIRRDYNPKQPGGPAPSQPTPPTQYLISPITGEKIPADKMQEHMRYGLLDPRWIQEQKRQVSQKQTKEDMYSEGVQIGSNLKQLAQFRTDIFGSEETMIGQKIGEEEVVKKAAPKVQWDGHASSADIIKKQAQARVTPEEKMDALKRAQGLLPESNIGPRKDTPPKSQAPPHPQIAPPISRPPSSAPPLPSGGPPRPILARPPHPPMGMSPILQAHPGMLPHPGLMQRLPNSAPPVPGMPPSQVPLLPHPPPPAHMNPDLSAPAPKRPRTEAEELVPENEFIALNSGPVQFQVQIPSIQDRPEWKLNGQLLNITLPITDPVSVIKAKIADELGMPTGKQKLQIGTIFIKDSNSLGFYNFTPATVVQLGLKERGGRKK